MMPDLSGSSLFECSLLKGTENYDKEELPKLEGGMNEMELIGIGNSFNSFSSCEELFFQLSAALLL